MVFVLVENLGDVAVGLRVSQLENIRARDQDLPGDFHRAAESKYCLLIPVVRLGLR